MKYTLAISRWSDKNDGDADNCDEEYPATM